MTTYYGIRSRLFRRGLQTGANRISELACLQVPAQIRGAQSARGESSAVADRPRRGGSGDRLPEALDPPFAVSAGRPPNDPGAPLDRRARHVAPVARVVRVVAVVAHHEHRVGG